MKKSSRLTAKVLFPFFCITGCATQRPIPQIVSEWGPVDPRPQAVITKKHRSDHSIRTELLAALAADPGLDVFDYRLKVQKKEVTIEGTTSSESERDRALEIAQNIDGAKAVHDHVKIRESHQNDLDEITQNEPLTDAQLRRDIIDRLIKNSGFAHTQPRVKVKDGRAILLGTVPYLRSKVLAEEIATKTPGVTSVTNQLRVDPSIERPDHLLKKDIVGALSTDPYLDLEEVKISVRNGVVYLSGKTASLDEKQNLITGISEILGVRAIQSNQLAPTSARG